MPTENRPAPDAADDSGAGQGDAPVPRASDDEVLEETVRLAREGLRQRENDPREPKSRS